MEKRKLRSITPEQVRELYARQMKEGIPTFHHEKEMAESLLNTRCNYLLAVLSIIIVADASAHTQVFLSIILCLGTIFSFVMGICIYRIYIKVEMLMDMLYMLEDHHVFPVIWEELAQWPAIKRGRSVLPLLGIYFPAFCTLLFVTGFILSLFCVLTVY